MTDSASPNIEKKKNSLSNSIINYLNKNSKKDVSEALVKQSVRILQQAEIKSKIDNISKTKPKLPVLGKHRDVKQNPASDPAALDDTKLKEALAKHKINLMNEKHLESKADYEGALANLKNMTAQEQAIQQNLDQMIDDAISKLNSSSDRYTNMLNSIQESVTDRGNTLSRAAFRG